MIAFSRGAVRSMSKLPELTVKLSLDRLLKRPFSPLPERSRREAGRIYKAEIKIKRYILGIFARLLGLS